MGGYRRKYNVFSSRQKIRALNSGSKPEVMEYYHVRDFEGNSAGFAGDLDGVKFLIRNYFGKSDDFVSEHYILVVRGEEDWYWAYRGSDRITRSVETTGIRKPQKWEYDLWIEEHRDDKKQNA